MDKTRNSDDLKNQAHNVIFQSGYAPEVVIREYGEDGINLCIVESRSHSLNINLKPEAVIILIDALIEYAAPGEQESDVMLQVTHHGKLQPSDNPALLDDMFIDDESEES